jgi:hypothetical protein
MYKKEVALIQWRAALRPVLPQRLEPWPSAPSAAGETKVAQRAWMADETVVVREVPCRHAVTSAASRAASSRRLGFDPEGRRRGLELTVGVGFRNKVCSVSFLN